MSNQCAESFISEDSDIIPESPAQPKKKLKCNKVNARSGEDFSEDEHVRDELQFAKMVGLFSSVDFGSNTDIAVNEEIAPREFPESDGSSVDVSEELEFLKSVDFSSTLENFGSDSSCGNVGCSGVLRSTSSSSGTFSPLADTSAPQSLNTKNVASSQGGLSTSQAPVSPNVGFPPRIGLSTLYPSGHTENDMCSSFNRQMDSIDGVWHFDDDFRFIFSSILPSEKFNADKLCIFKGSYNLPMQNEPLKVSKNKMSFVFHNHKDFLTYTETRLPKHNNVKMVGTVCYTLKMSFLKEYNPSPKVNKDVFVIMKLNIPCTVPNVGDCIEAYGFVELALIGRKTLPILNVLFWKQVNSWSQKEYLRLLEIQKLFVPIDYKEELVATDETTLDDTYQDTLNDITQLFNDSVKV